MSANRRSDGRKDSSKKSREREVIDIGTVQTAAELTQGQVSPRAALLQRCSQKTVLRSKYTVRCGVNGGNRRMRDHRIDAQSISDVVYERRYCKIPSCMGTDCGATYEEK